MESACCKHRRGFAGRRSRFAAGLRPRCYAVLNGQSRVYARAGQNRHRLPACLAANEDFIGWIHIPGTTVDYPVVQTDDVDYYLNHTFAGKKSYIGTLLSLEKTNFLTPSRNIAIYGHHIRSNDQVMFSPLLAYKEPSFYNDHQTVYFDTLYHPGIYTVFRRANNQYPDRL